MWWWTFSESSNWGLKTGGGSPLPTGQYQAERGEAGFCFGIPISICSLLFFAHLEIKRKCGSQRPPDRIRQRWMWSLNSILQFCIH